MRCVGSKKRREEIRIAQQAAEIQAKADRQQAEAMAASFHAATWVPPQHERPLGMALMKDWHPLCARCIDEGRENPDVVAVANGNSHSAAGDFLCPDHLASES